MSEPSARSPAPAEVQSDRAHNRLEFLVWAALLLLPVLALPAAVFWHLHRPIGALEIALLLGMAVPTQLGITVGYHRLFTHRSFRAKPWVAGALGLLGSMAQQGHLLFWVAIHRHHHAHSDQEGDAHSPALEGGLRGLWHSHLGWMLSEEVLDDFRRGQWGRLTKDLIRDPVAWRVQELYFAAGLAGLLIPTASGAAAAGLIGGLAPWEGAVSGLIWGGLLRVLLVNHVTWSVNSICHRFGRRHFEVADDSRNNALVGILALGEGWHNNHHAFPASARHGLLPGQPDLSWWLIRALERGGLAWDVKLPSAAAMTRRRLEEP